MRTTCLSQLATCLLVALVALPSTLAAIDDSLGARRKHHADLARRLGPQKKAELLSKRSNSGRGTFYDISPGDQGACGDMLNANDFFVALNKPQYGDINSKSSHCGKEITITCGGKTANAYIKDACPECPPNALDLSPSLFKHFADESKGVIDLVWWFADENHAAADANAKKADEEAANKKKKEEEDAANKQKAEQEAAANQKKKEEEDAANQRKKSEEEAAEAAKKKAEDDKRKADAARKQADDKKKADAEKAAKEKKAADDAAAKQKAEEDQRAKDAAAAEEEKKKKQQPKKQQLPSPPQKEKKVGVEQTEEQHEETKNIACFNKVLQGLDLMVQDGHAHKG